MRLFDLLIMNNKMNINPKSLIALVILMAIGLFASFQIYTASNLVTQLHRHAFMVSNAVRDINVNILNIHHRMAEVALVQNQADFNSVVNRINLYEQQVYQQIAFINERFLGDKQKVEQLKRLFTEWQPIRQEIIVFIKAGQREKAAVLFEEKDHAHVVRLEKAIGYLVAFSNQKADEFLTHAHNQFQLSYFWALIVFLVVIIMAILIKQVKKAFHQSEERYRAIVEGQTELVCRFLPDTTLTFVNSAYCRYFGVQEQDILGQPFLLLIPEKAHKVSLELIQGLFNNPQLISKTVEHPVQSDNGEITWQRWTNRVILDRDGAIIEFQSVGIDITERKQMEEKLTQTTEQLSLLLENIPIVPYTAEAEGDFKATYINQSVTAITGYVPEDFTANPSFWADHIHPEDKPFVFENMNKVVEQGRQEMEYRWQVAEGAYKWFSDIARLVKNSDNSHYIVGAWHDITKRKLIKKALDESNKRYRNIIEVANEGIWFIDANNITTFVNKNMAKMLGYSEAGMLGKSLFMFMDDKWHQQAEQNIKRRRQGIPEQHDFKFQRKDGTALWAILNTRPLFDKTGQYTGTFAMVTDITERQKMEDALREQREFLRLIIDNIPQYIFWKDIARDITARQKAQAQLQQAKDAAESANRAKSTFLANMSHEVRTPLNGILGYTQLLKRDDTLSTQQKEGIDVIHRSGEYLLTLINDILDISKIEANRVELYQTDFDLNDFLKSFVDLFRMRSQEKGIDFIYQALTPLPHIIYADEKRLRQIIINLLSNAIKFTNVGGVTLKVGVIESIEEERESIQGESEKAALHQTRIRFQVEDTGIGIAQTALSKIFIPFQQVGERKYQSAGTGLGLSITQKLVDLMGGQLQVESTLEQGSTFGIELDLATVSPRQIVDKPLPKKSQTISFEGPPRKILVVEDNQDNRLVLTHLLIALGFEVKEAKNGQDAINQTHEWRPDFIFMDIVMPVIDGYEATRQIKRIPELQKTIIVAVSASAFKSHQQESQEAGCDDFIAKPIHTEELLKCLQRHFKFKVIESESKTTKDTLQESEDVWLQEPSVEQATTLFNLTLRGDLDGILEYVNKLEQNEPQLRPFINQIKGLAKELKIKRIRQIVQQYM